MTSREISSQMNYIFILNIFNTAIQYDAWTFSFFVEKSQHKCHVSDLSQKFISLSNFQ